MPSARKEPQYQYYMPIQNSERDDKEVLYQITNFKLYANLKSYIDLAEYISKAKATSILLTPAAFGYLTPAASFTSFGFPASLLPRTKGSVLEIANPDLDPRLAGHVFLAAQSPVRFFAAVPLFGRESELLGYLSFKNDHPQTFDEGQKKAIFNLSHQVAASLENLAPARRYTPDSEYGQLWVARNLDQGVTISDIDGHVIWVNEAFTKITGYTPEEVAGNQAGQMLCRRDTNIAAIRKIRKRAGITKTVTTELQAYQKNGDPYWISVTSSFVREQQGHEARIIEVFTDITEKKKSEIELNTLALAIGKSSGAVSVLDKTGSLIWANPALEKITGYSFADLKGKKLDPLLNMFSDKTSRETAQRIRKAIKTNQSYTEELQIACKDQTRKWILINGNPVLDKYGKLERSVNSIIDITSRRKAEQEMARFSEVVNQTSNAIIFRDLTGKITWVNESYKRFFGYSADEAIGTRFNNLVAGKNTDQRKLKSIISRIRSGEGGTLDMTLYHKNGRPVSILGTLMPIAGENGKIEGTASILTDISGTKEVEKELRELSLIATESPGGVLVRSPKGVALWANKAFIETSGYTEKELIGKDVTGLFIGPETDLKIHSKAIRKRSKGKEMNIELQLYKKDGTPIWLQLLTYPIHNEHGEIESMVTLTQDINERKKKDEQFQMLSLVASKTVTGVAINDKQGKVFWCNQSLEKMTGFSLEEVKGQLLWNVFKGHDTDMKELRNVRKIASEKRSFYTELVAYKKDGTPMWLAVSSSPVLDETGHLIHQVDIINDITGRKEAELQLVKTKDEALQLSKAKEMFLSVMSHEIRTPLNSINGISQLLMEENPTKTQREYLSLLQFSGQNLSTLINDLLDLTKIETGNLTLERRRVNLNELLANTISSLQLKADENSTVLSLDISPDVPENVHGDQVRLYQILMNLTGNAIKFTRKGKVKVSVQLVRQTRSTVTIGFKVADTGIGIPADKLESIFEAYRQASTDTTRKFGGTGLGLTITRSLLKIHGSDIRVSSKPGKGSVFSFDIEFKKAGSREMPAVQKQSVSALPILIADDNAINRRIAEKLLTGSYKEIHFAENGEIAFRMVQERQYACVLMDVFMPVMDGLEATSRIRSLSDPYFQELPVIAFTASTDETDLRHIRDCGMNGHIIKPLTKENLGQISQYAGTEISLSSHAK